MESPRHDVSKGATPKDISPKKSSGPGTSSDKRQTLIKNTKQLFGARMNTPKLGKCVKYLMYLNYVFLKSIKFKWVRKNIGQIRSQNCRKIS